MGAADEAAADQSGQEVPITVLVDSEVLGRLERERLAMAEPDIRATVRRRLEATGRQLAHLERGDLLWPPPLRERSCLHVRPSAESLAQLKRQADRLDVDEQILLTGILSDDLFLSPLALVDRDDLLSGYLRSERGRGRIYGMRFEVAGYQYAFLKVVAGAALVPAQVFELAIMSLAERIGRGDPPPGLRLSRDAVVMAGELAARARRLSPKAYY